MTPATSLPILILLAIMGGMILNLMPCVFPVLSIKAMGLVEQAKKHPAAVRAKGMVFAAGVISSMLCLAAALLIVRAGGEEVGWGFQLQSPLFVTLMVYLLFAVGLNLSGVFEIGGGLAGVGDGLTQGDGYRASFFTGVLTTLVATPCTAPFMGCRGRRRTHAVGAGRAVHFCSAGIWAFPAVPAAVLRPVAAPCAAQARRVDGYIEAGIRLSDICVRGMAAVGARPANIILRFWRCIGRDHSHRPGRVGISEVQFQFRRRQGHGTHHRGGWRC